MAIPLGAAAVGGSLISGALDQMFSSFGAGRNWNYRKKEMELQQQYNERNMYLQYGYQRDMFDYQANYNSPVNSVARWRAAGIAPEAVYGSSPGGAGVGGFSGSISSSNPSAGGDYNGSGRSPVMSPSEAVRLRNETNVADAEVQLKKAQAREANSRATGQDNTNSIFDLFKRAQELANDNAELEKRIKAIEEKYAEANAVKDLEIKDSILRETDERISNLMSDRLYKEKATEKLKSDMDLIKAQIATESSKQHNLDADTDYKKSLKQTEDDLREVRKKLTESERNKIIQDIRNSKALTAKEIEQFAQWLNGNYPTSSIAGVADKLARKWQIRGSSIDDAETIRQNLLDYLRGFKD